MIDNYLIREISCVFEQLAAARAMLDRMDVSLECLDEYVTELSEEKPYDVQYNRDYYNGFDAGVDYAKTLLENKVKDEPSVKRPCTCDACESPEWYVMD